MNGILNITLEKHGEKTVVRKLRQQAPLRVIRPFYPEGEGPAHLYLLNTTAGILEGDRIELTICLEKGSHLLMTTPSATRVHPMPTGEACQRTRIEVGPEAILEFLPEPVLPYAGSAFRQTTEIVLKEGAILFYLDLLGPGRLGRGEAFAYRSYQGDLQVSDEGGTLLRERFFLAPSDRPLDVIGAMEGYSHLGTLSLFCPEEKRNDLLSAFRAVKADLFWGATLLARRGIVVKALAHDTPALRDFFLPSGESSERRFWAGRFLRFGGIRNRSEITMN